MEQSPPKPAPKPLKWIGSSNEHYENQKQQKGKKP